MSLTETVISQFEKKSGLKVEKILEHRTVQWGSGEVTNLFVFSVAEKKHSAFAFFEPNDIKKWGFILPCARYGLKNEKYD